MTAPQQSEPAEVVRPAAWPYTSFRTILNLVQKLEDQGAVPPRIDRGFLTGSEGSKTQLLSALKFLGLIVNGGEVSQDLVALVADPENRPQLIRRLLEQFYPEQNRLASRNATQSQLEETFASLAGATRRKAVAFYLHAAEYAKLPLSKFFKTPRIGAAARADIPTRRRKREPLEERGSPSEAQPSAADMKQRYLDLLMKRVESEEQLDEKLLDRIEALLGYQKPE